MGGLNEWGVRTRAGNGTHRESRSGTAGEILARGGVGRKGGIEGGN